MVFCMGFTDWMEWTERMVYAELNEQRNRYNCWTMLKGCIRNECLLRVRGYSVNDFYRNMSDLNWFDQSLYRPGILKFHYGALSESRWYFHALIVVFSWYSLNMIMGILVKTVFSCLGWVLSWSGGYFHVLIKMVFSYVIYIDIVKEFR